MGITIPAMLTVIFTVLLIYPYVVYPLIVRRLPTRPVARQDGFAPSCTLVFCAYNEGGIIEQKLSNIEMLKARHPGLEALAFDDGSGDATGAVLSSRPDLVTAIRGNGRSGKAHGMKRLAARAKGEILVFTDANVMLDERALENLLAYYADPAVGGVCGSLRHYSDKDASSTATIGSLYWRLEESIKDAESRTGSTMGADGAIFSLRRELYPDFPDTVLDDLTVSMAAVFAGYRLIKVDDVIGYEDIVSSREAEFARKIRIAARAYHTHRYLLPKLRRMSRINRFKYFSRKVLRWFGGSFLLAGAFFATLTLALMSLPVFVLGFVCASLLLWVGMTTRRGMLANLFEIAMALIATQIGVLQAMFGRTFSVWQPAERSLPQSANASGQGVTRS